MGVTFPPDPLSLITWASRIHYSTILIYHIISYLSSEMCDGGSLNDYLCHNTIDGVQKLRFISDIALGMQHLHKENVIHRWRNEYQSGTTDMIDRDLAARNILLSKHLEAKVGDFGLSRETSSEANSGTTTSHVGPIKWMAPEGVKTTSNCHDFWRKNSYERQTIFSGYRCFRLRVRTCNIRVATKCIFLPSFFLYTTAEPQRWFCAAKPHVQRYIIFCHSFAAEPHVQRRLR